MLRCCTIKDNKLILRVLLQPGAKTDEIVGLYGDNLKIRINAAAIEGRANLAALKFLAKQFNVPRKNIILAKGKQTRHKQFVIQDIKELPTWLHEL